MIDAIYAVMDQIKKPDIDTKYSSDQAISDVDFLHVPGSTTLTVVFPPWHNEPVWLSARHKAKVQATGSSALFYRFSPFILSGDSLTVKNSFEYIALAISQDVINLTKEYGFQEINLLGFSLGNVALGITAEKIPLFHKVTMVVPGSELAAPFWFGLRTRRLSHIFRTEGYNLPQLQAEWADLAPENHIQCLRGHDLTIVLASHDQYIPYRFGKKFVDKLQAAGVSAKVSTSPFGHVATIVKYQY